MAISIADIEKVLKSSEYSGGAYFKDHRPEKYNLGVRVWYLPNNILLRTPPIRVPPEESSKIQHLNIHTKAANNYNFESIARKIAGDANVDVTTTPNIALLDSKEINPNDI